MILTCSTKVRQFAVYVITVIYEPGCVVDVGLQLTVVGLIESGVIGEDSRTEHDIHDLNLHQDVIKRPLGHLLHDDDQHVEECTAPADSNNHVADDPYDILVAIDPSHLCYLYIC